MSLLEKVKVWGRGPKQDLDAEHASVFDEETVQTPGGDAANDPLPLSFSVPAFTVVRPRYAFVPVSKSVAWPVLTIPPGPPIPLEDRATWVPLRSHRCGCGSDSGVAAAAGAQQTSAAPPPLEVRAIC